MQGAPPPGSTGDITHTPDSRRCVNCGAPLRFDPAHGDLRCKHCRAAEAVEAVASAPVELDYAATVGSDASTAPDVEPVRLQCTDCGAPADYPPNTLASSCPYCRAPFVGAPASTRDLRPGAVLPLAVTEEQARANTRTWLGNRWFAPRHLDKAATEALRSSYTPTWVFSMATTADYRGQRGDNYLDTETYTTTDSNGNTTTQTRTVTKIRWSGASGTVHMTFRGVTAYAGTDPLSRFGEDLEPWGVDEVEPYRDDLLRGSSAQTYTVPPAAGLERARQRTTGALEDTIRQDIGGDHQQIGSVDRHDRDIRFRYVLLPGWEATYSHSGETYQLAINGRTGEVDGTRPYSKVKIAVAVAVAVAVVALAIFLIVRANSSEPTAPTTTQPITTVTVPTTTPSTAEAITPTSTLQDPPAPTAPGVPTSVDSAPSTAAAGAGEPAPEPVGAPASASP